MNETVKLTEIIQTIASLAGVIISIVGFLLVWRQIKQTNENLKQSNHTAIYSINTEIYKYIAENSHLRPYLYDNKKLEKGDPHYQQFLGVSEMLADFFEFIVIEKDLLDRKLVEPWEFYMTRIYLNSQAFRDFIEDNKDQYTEDLYHVLHPSDRTAEIADQN